MEQTPKAILEVRLIKLLRLQVHLSHLVGDPDLTQRNGERSMTGCLSLTGVFRKRGHSWRRHRAGRATVEPVRLDAASSP